MTIISRKTPFELKNQQLANRKRYEIFFLLLISLFCTEVHAQHTTENLSTSSNSYYIDAISGNDNNEGTMNSPWKSLDKITARTFLPGDNIYFKRGTSYNGSVTINGNGTQSMPITVGAYGTGAAPRLTNPNYEVNNGNAMRVRGDFQIVENLYFHHTAPAPTNASSFEEVWEVGALHISMGNDYAIIRNNEFANVPKAIQSYSQHSLITGNYIHDANMDQENGFLQNPYWGPIGIQLGIGNQEVSHNRIENMYATGGAFGADGGAIEIDDGRNHKDNINIHHNRTYHNMGFLEVSYWDDIAFKESNNMVVEYNLSRDYQSFLLWWAPTHNSLVKNNTIIRDDNEVQGNWNAVFILDAPPGDINLTKNIVVVDNDQTEAIFIQGYDGAVNNVNHTDNCYWNVAGGSINLGLTKQSSEIFSDPLFISYTNKNYYLQNNSPANGWGAFGVMETDADGDGYNATVDCDDTNANINPSQSEIPYNGIDDDCNAATRDDDLDQDGVGVADDCNDLNANIYPNASEIADNGIDEDCDGQDSTSGNVCNDENMMLNDHVISAQIYETNGTIVSAQHLSNGGVVIYDSNNSITLMPGFLATGGATLHAFIEGCDENMVVEAHPPAENREIPNMSVPAKLPQILTLTVVPNPFKHNPSIKYEIVEAGYSTLMIVNALGQPIKQLFSNTWQASGKYSFTLESHLFPKGIYFAILKNGKQVSTQKFIKN